MEKLKFPNVTLVLLSGLGYRQKANVHALEYSQKGIEFGAVKYVQLGEIKDIDSWSKAAIYELPKYVETEFCLLIHENGFVVNPEQWNPEWLNYDYIGAPWPLPQDSFSYRDEEGNIVRVGNSVSLRSKKLMDLVAQKAWRSFFGFYNEDGFITCHHRRWLELQGCTFAPIEVAKHFSRELDIPENADVDEPFCFHYNRVLSGRNEEFKHLILEDKS